MIFIKNGQTNNNGKIFSLSRTFIGKAIQREKVGILGSNYKGEKQNDFIFQN